MKILQVIHGYPMRYNAGSEVYTQTLCRGLAERHEVHVFTREEDPFAPDFRLRVEPDPEDPRITLHVAPARTLLDRYRDEFGVPARKLVHLDSRAGPDGRLARRRLPDLGHDLPDPRALPRLQHAQIRGGGGPGVTWRDAGGAGRGACCRPHTSVEGQ